MGGRWWEGGVSQQLIGGTRWEELPPSSASSPTTRNDKAPTHCDTLLSYKALRFDAGVLICKVPLRY